jgi:predicted restriction endonuclease
MSKVLDELSKSDDPIDREISQALKIYQEIRKSQNLSRSIGYEPRDIRKHGAIEVIERRVRKSSSGFDIVPAKDSYEAIVLRHPDRFKAEIVAISRERIGQEEETFGPTADPMELDRKVKQLLDRTYLSEPQGTVSPRKAVASSTVFLRDPRVKAFVLKRSGGRCESCATPAPFKTSLGLDYLEVHHMKTLVQGGSDRVQNTVALCPNCHRALHYASNAAELARQVYKLVTHLIQE